MPDPANEAPEPEVVEADEVESAQPRPGRRDLWQAPALLIGAALLVAGIAASRATRERNDFDGALTAVERLIQRQDPDTALRTLEEAILPFMVGDEVSPVHVRRAHMARADAHFLKAVDYESGLEAVAASVVADYEAAERLQAVLSPTQQANFATALLALDREAEALARVRGLPDSHASVRQELLHRVVERNLALGAAKYDVTLRLLTEMGGEPGLSEGERQWVMIRQAELRLGAGYPEEALEHLLREMQRVGSIEKNAGELYLLLARAYFDLGRFSDADRQLERAGESLGEADPLRGDMLVLEGRVRQIAGELQDAGDRYSVAVAEHPGARTLLRGVLGLAEVEAALGQHKTSLENYARTVEGLPEAGARSGVTREGLASSLLDRASERYLQGDFRNALAFAELAERVFEGSDAPPGVYLSIAQAHRAAADELAGEADPETGERPDVLTLDPVSRAEARAHYSEAGEYFLAHARRELLIDDDAFGDSLWNAADSFDLAGMQDRAIEVFSEYTVTRTDDPRQPDAVYRLGRAHQARGDYEIASSFLTGLVEEHPNSRQAAKAHVPLAQCLLSDDDASNDQEAVALLLRVVNGDLLAPAAPEFRVALFELGRHFLRSGEHARAITRLEEAVQRYPDDAKLAEVKFLLAEANRRSAVEIADTLREAMPESRRSELEDLRAERLERALELYDAVRETLDSRDERRRTDVESLYLRNAYFYRADCAFDRRDFEVAIRYYDAAAQRFASDPASLVAMVQIVNAYVELGRWPEARTANERARHRLRELPEGSLDAPDLPMERRHWERWLNATADLDARAIAAGEDDTGQ